MRLRSLFAAVLVALVVVPAGAADRVYHSQHLALMRAGTDPLRKGFVENIHPNGPNVYAHEIYVLIGAQPNATYTVHLLVHLFSPMCGNVPTQFAVTQLTTNRSGKRARGSVHQAAAPAGDSQRDARRPVGSKAQRDAPVRDGLHGGDTRLT